MWNDKFKLPDGSYSLSDVQDYFEYIIKRHEVVTDNSPVAIYINKIESRITFKIRLAYYLDFLSIETMELLESTKIK